MKKCKVKESDFVHFLGDWIWTKSKIPSEITPPLKGLTLVVPRELVTDKIMVSSPTCSFFISLKLGVSSYSKKYSTSYSPSLSPSLKELDVRSILLQGISYWNVFYELTRTDKNMQARICLKVILRSWDYGFLVFSTSFSKKLHIRASTASDRNCIRY